MPFFLVCDSGSCFESIFLSEWALDNQVIIKFSSNYHPQWNSMLESTNKNLIIVIKKMLKENQKD